MSTIHHITVANFSTCSGALYQQVTQSYQIFGQPLHTAPIILVHHALTGNSQVAHPKTGWWRNLIGSHKVIDTKAFTIIAFDTVGNGYDLPPAHAYNAFTAADIAALQYRALEQLGVRELHTIIGGSVGGGIGWEMVISHPQLSQQFIPIASAWNSSNWIIGQCWVQDNILAHSTHPMADAREMAMLWYRSPASLDAKFGNDSEQVTRWLQHHGQRLQDRFSFAAYRAMNYILANIQASQHPQLSSQLSQMNTAIHQVSICSDGLFYPSHNQEIKHVLNTHGVVNSYSEIDSIHGHDAFLIEYPQLHRILTPLFTHQS